MKELDVTSIMESRGFTPEDASMVSDLDEYILFMHPWVEDSDVLMKDLGLDHAHAIAGGNWNEECTSRRTRRK